MHPELLQSAEQGHKEQPSEVEKPHTPPKRETPLVPLQRSASPCFTVSSSNPPCCPQQSCSVNEVLHAASTLLAHLQLAVAGSQYWTIGL